jgi:integrase
MLPMKTPQFKLVKTAGGWRINVPAFLSPEGKRSRRFFRNREEAEGFAGNLRMHFLQQKTDARVISPAESDAASRALEILGENASPETLIEAVREYVARHNLRLASIPFEDAFQQFRDAQPRSPSYAESLKQYRRRFAAFDGRMLCDITARDIETVMADFPSTVFNYAMRILSALFNHGIKRDWCAMNPITKLDRKKLPPREVEIYTPRQVAALFRVADPALVPWLATCMFAGVRAAEARKMVWSDFDFEENFCRVRAIVSKTHRPRAIPMEPCLREWLLPYRADDSAPIAPQGQNVLRSELRKAHLISSVPQIKHGPRHCYASYLLARDGDIDAVVLALGHTNAAMTFQHYHRVASARAAKTFWNIFPPRRKVRKIVPMVG